MLTIGLLWIASSAKVTAQSLDWPQWEAGKIGSSEARCFGFESAKRLLVFRSICFGLEDEKSGLEKLVRTKDEKIVVQEEVIEEMVRQQRMTDSRLDEVRANFQGLSKAYNDLKKRYDRVYIWMIAVGIICLAVGSGVTYWIVR